MPRVRLVDPDVDPTVDALEAVSGAMAAEVCRGADAVAEHVSAARPGKSGGTRQPPVLIAFAGPNGSGKTTMAHVMLRHGWLDGFEYINPDNIARDRFGDWNNPAAVLQAARVAATARQACLKDRRALAIETVFSSHRSFGFVREAREAGFFVRVFFVGTDHPSINVRRVAHRVRLGGHDVPTAKIVARYPRSIANLASLLAWANRVHVYDNSVDGAPPVQQIRTCDGAVSEVYTTGHEWADGARRDLPVSERHIKGGT